MKHWAEGWKNSTKDWETWVEVKDSLVAVAQSVYRAGGQVCPWGPTWAFFRWTGWEKYKADKRESLRADVVGQVEEAAFRWEYTRGERGLCQHSRQGDGHRDRCL